ncbi:arylsulfatase [Echinicola pacifica]|uniref:Arylsulfatase n=1 Tax=Echinicola pacifica TaxID=346377 RepID=A0A918Q5A1_9BACT|nr:arylsulfatase [Echinicola pacifica]GGZ33193.1 arylsulfatase [Echinicola pacifica]
MKNSILLFTCLFLTFLVSCKVKNTDTKNKAPNIIIILADDMGYGDIVAYNSQAKVSTPYLDQLANEGMLFTDAHSPSAVCTPTRYGILTGRYSWRTRLKSGVLHPWELPLIEAEQETMAEMLRKAGYSTAAIGKWHLGWDWPVTDAAKPWSNNGGTVDYFQEVKGGPLAVGFDYYFGDDVPNYPPYAYIENEHIVEAPTLDKPKDYYGLAGMMSPGWTLEAVMPRITKEASDYILSQSKSQKPFFMYFALTAPHTPIAPSEEFVGTSKAGKYGDFVQQVDWTVGQIVSALEEAGLTEETLLVFTSDNGSPARNGENYSGPVASVIADYGHAANGDYRGLKGDAWEGGHRVPFIVKWPGSIPKNSENTQLVSSLDLMATVRDLIGGEYEQNVSPDGLSFLPTLKDPSAPGRESLVLHSHRGVFVYRKGPWKFIESNLSGGFSDGLNPDGYGIDTPGQLYNLEEDPGETSNRYSDFPDMVQELTHELDSVRNLAN